MSLAYTITHLALLHFRILPSFSPRTLARRRLSPNPAAPSPHHSIPSTTTTLTLLLFTALYTLAWFTQSALCTACEMAPIAAGTQGQVPAWCPQSRFRDVRTSSPQDSLDRAAMLASLALAKDAINWVIFVAGLCMVECCRRGWKCAQVLEAEMDREGMVRAYDPGAVQRSWSTKSGPGPEVYDMESLVPPAKVYGDGARREKKNSWMGIRAVQQVPVNLNVPGGYATRV